jgi:cytochrome P450
MMHASPPEASPSSPLREIPPASTLEPLRWLLRFRRHALELTTQMHEHYGSVVVTRAFGMRFVSLFGADAARFLLLDREQVLSARLAWEWIMGRIFGGGLMLRDGEDHRHHRAIMQTAFKKAALEEYLERMNPQIATGLAAFGRNGGQVHAFPTFKHLTLDLAASVFLGLKLGPEVSRMNEAFEATVAASMSTLRLNIPGTEFGRGLAGRRYLEELFGGMIPERRAGTQSDMFSRLCRATSEEGERYTDREIIDHFIFLMMAAHDTTTSTLTSMIYLLAEHPEWQDRLREECLGVGGEELAYEDLSSLVLVERAMKETLRRFPPLSTIPRTALRDFEFQGFRIPKGALVSVYPIHTHHMKEYWSDPFGFDPDRFSEERAEHRRHTHAWLPFGGGAHMCLGMVFADLQVKAILHRLLRDYRWELPPGYRIAVQEAPISKPLDGLPLLVTPLRGVRNSADTRC